MWQINVKGNFKLPPHPSSEPEKKMPTSNLTSSPRQQGKYRHIHVPLYQVEGVSVELLDGTGMTPLMHASWKGHAGVTK